MSYGQRMVYETKLFWTRWHGVVLTLIAVAIIQVLMIQSHIPFTPSAALAFIPLVYTAYNSGLIPAVLSATVVALFVLFSPSFTFDRAAQVVICAYTIAIPMGVLKRRARLSESVNGNLKKIREVELFVDYLIKNRHEMNDGAIFRFLTEVQDRIGNLSAFVRGWQQIGEEREREEMLLRQGIVSRIIAEFEPGDPGEAPKRVGPGKR